MLNVGSIITVCCLFMGVSSVSYMLRKGSLWGWSERIIKLHNIWDFRLIFVMKMRSSLKLLRRCCGKPWGRDVGVTIKINHGKSMGIFEMMFILFLFFLHSIGIRHWTRFGSGEEELGLRFLENNINLE